MTNAIYTSACLCGEGGTLTLNEDIDILTDNNVDVKASWGELLEKFCDEPVYKHYEENKKIVTAVWGLAAAAVVGGLVVAACVVTGGLAAGLVVAGSAALVGGISSATNYAFQKGEISLNGEGNIDWYQVAIAGFGGAISGAVAASPLGVGGQMIVNGAIGGLQSYSTGQSTCSILCNTGAGIFAGYIGGAGPDWNDTNIFIPHQVREGYGLGLYKTLKRARKSFILVWRGLDTDRYITKQFGGILSGFIKGWALSNTINILSNDPEDFAKKIWEKYKPDWLKEEAE